MRSGNQKNHGIDLRVKGSGRGQYKAGQESSRTPDTFLGLTRLSRKPVNPQELPAQATRVCPISSLKSAFEPHRTLSTPRLNPRFCLELGQTRKSYYKINATLSPIFIPRSLTNPAFASKTKLASCLGATMIFLESAEVAAIFS